MNQSRRDLLKFFAAGTIIAPVAGGATAKLIEVPKAELIVAPETQIVRPFRPENVECVNIEMTMRDGTKRVISGGRVFPGLPIPERFWRDGTWRCDVAIENVGSPSSYWTVVYASNGQMK